MNVYNLTKTQFLNCTIEEAWDYFSSPKNLKELTPEYMDFIIKSDLGDGTMYQGQIIEYTVKPIMRIPIQWITEITHLKQHFYFVDEQKSGPYRLWHHQHKFEKKDNGVLMTDIVHYALPLSFLGVIANSLFVKRQLKNIFDYRNKKVSEIF